MLRSGVFLYSYDLSMGLEPEKSDSIGRCLDVYSRTGKVRLVAKNIGFRMELLGTPKVRLGVPA